MVDSLLQGSSDKFGNMYILYFLDKNGKFIKAFLGKAGKLYEGNTLVICLSF